MIPIEAMNAAYDAIEEETRPNKSR
jgi:hypothetical protein